MPKSAKDVKGILDAITLNTCHAVNAVSFKRVYDNQELDSFQNEFDPADVAEMLMAEAERVLDKNLELLEALGKLLQDDGHP